MKYYNQNNYPNVPYNPKGQPNYGATIKSGGCGLACSSNVLSFFGYNFPPDKLVQLFVQEGARVVGGTEMSIASRLIAQLSNNEISFTTTRNINILQKHLQNNGIAIINVTGNRLNSKGEVAHYGIFSDSGHFINIIGYDNQMPKSFALFDVGNYNEKYNFRYRKNFVTVSTDKFNNVIQYASAETISNDTNSSIEPYYLYTKKDEGLTMTQYEELKARLDKYDELFDGQKGYGYVDNNLPYEQDKIQLLIDEGIIDGKTNLLMPRYLFRIFVLVGKTVSFINKNFVRK